MILVGHLHRSYLQLFPILLGIDRDTGGVSGVEKEDEEKLEEPEHPNGNDDDAQAPVGDGELVEAVIYLDPIISVHSCRND